jgi:hypothetical protein
MCCYAELHFILLNVVILSVVILSDIMLDVIVLNVANKLIMLKVVAPPRVRKSNRYQLFFLFENGLAYQNSEFFES